MKDAYSFHADETDLQETYAAMAGAYQRIFERCGLDAVGVDADSGAIGGAASQEFMVTADAGEDLILTSSDGSYAANQEKAVSIPPPAEALPAGDERTLKTPGQTTIEQLCSAHEFSPTQIIKVLVLVARLEDGREQPVLVSLRGDQELNEVKLTNTLTRLLESTVLDVAPATPDQVRQQGLAPLAFGSLGPDLDDAALRGARRWEGRFERLADPTALEVERFVCGSNVSDQHRWGASWSSMPKQHSADVRNARSGDRCIHNAEATLGERRGIEVGHIFQLGRKYSDALDARFTNKDGKQESLLMGCYGIGISRLAQAAVEQHHDDAGICWPVAIAPFQVIVVVANLKDSTQLELGESLYQQLKSAGLDALLDDRGERAGVKFKDADLIGIPWRIVVGRDAAEGRVELVERATRASETLPHEEALKRLIDTIPAGIQI